jgi:hypothetical protein
MKLPNSNGFNAIAYARCSMMGWAEWRMMKEENSHTIGCFMFEEVLCRWGSVVEIVTDNGGPWIKAITWLANRYNIHHIKISGYNSHANRPVERHHYNVHEAVSKACKGDLSKWTERIFYVFWAEHVSVA